MDANKKLLLLKHKQDIINDLEVPYIGDQLLDKKVISFDEYGDLNNLVSIVNMNFCYTNFS